MTPDVVFARPLTCRMPSGVVDAAWVKRDGTLVWVHPHMADELVAQGARRLYVEVTYNDIPDVPDGLEHHHPHPTTPATLHHTECATHTHTTTPTTRSAHNPTTPWAAGPGQPRPSTITNRKTPGHANTPIHAQPARFTDARLIGFCAFLWLWGVDVRPRFVVHSPRWFLRFRRLCEG